MVCPACGKDIVHVRGYIPGQGIENGVLLNGVVFPKGINRSPLSAEVPEEFADDYRQAALILNDSPMASAAVSRRLLQHLLVKLGKATKKDLAHQIDELLPTFPGDIRPLVDAIRNLGNIAAHPMTSQSTGEIVAVEPHEAELLIDTVEQLFDFYFVRPAEMQKKIDAINAKLKDAGKPPMKS